MKKVISSAIVLCTLSLTTITVLNSCNPGSDTEIENNQGNTNTDPNNFRVVLNSGDKLVLDATKTYKLTGAVIVNNGAELIIPAGTKFICSGGTSSYVAVAQGGKIYINGTSTNPVIFTSETQRKADWGGIVICGKAPINASSTAGGSATSEVANLTYGGSVLDDNSGVITYTQVKYAGARFSDTKEYNGLSLFGVGNKTRIEGLALIDGADDGIEFFGGTVNVSKIISINNDDDAFDWTEGWNGTAIDVYTKRTSANIGNRGIEADNNSINRSATPMSNPTIKNATLIGYTTSDNEGFGTNIFREGTNATLDNIVFSGWERAITIQHDESIALLNGKNKFTNIKFDNVVEKAVTISSNKVTKQAEEGTFTENKDAKGAGNGLDLPSWAAGWSGL